MSYRVLIIVISIFFLFSCDKNNINKKVVNQNNDNKTKIVKQNDIIKNIVNQKILLRAYRENSCTKRVSCVLEHLRKADAPTGPSASCLTSTIPRPLMGPP